MKKLILIIMILDFAVIFGQTTRVKSNSFKLQPLRSANISKVISFNNPDIKNNAVINLTDNEINISGKVDTDKGIKSLLINDRKVEITENESFAKTISLDEGENEVNIKIIDMNNSEKGINFKVISELSAPIFKLADFNMNERNEIFSENHKILISGQVDDFYGIAQVKINDMVINCIDNKFSQEVFLPFDENLVTLEAINVKGKREINKLTIVKKKPVKIERPRVNHALLFATDDYDSFNDLSNPVFDASTIEMELRDNYDFKTQFIKNPVRDTILAKLRSYSRKKYGEEDQLIIFFAGHGIFDNIYGEGFLVASDTRIDDIVKSSYLSYSKLNKIVNNIPCEHILLVIDACFGGTFDERIASRGESLETDEREKKTKNWIKKKLKLKTRKYITSGGKEYVSDGRQGHHSPFARQILEALRSDGGRDGILTLSELLANLEGIDPEPRSSEFGDNQPGSSFLFITK